MMKKNTIIIILIALAIAGSLIIWRLGAIPETEAPMTKRAMRLKDQAATRNEGQIKSITAELNANEKEIARSNNQEQINRLEERNEKLRAKLDKLQQ